MIVKPISFIQIEVGTDHIYGLTANGEVWYRAKIPYSSTYSYQYNQYSSTPTNTRKEEVKKEEEAIWKPLKMLAFVELPVPEEKSCPVIETKEKDSEQQQEEDVKSYPSDILY